MNILFDIWVISRETIILTDPAHTTTLAKLRTAVMIAHEMAHQWFGNLVTMVIMHQDLL